jgi:hypothetical protein
MSSAGYETGCDVMSLRDQLRGRSQPTEQTQGQRWNPTTFRPAVLAACVVTADGEDPMSADDWEQAAKLGEIGVGEYNALFSAAVNLNLRAPASAVGNGS